MLLSTDNRMLEFLAAVRHEHKCILHFHVIICILCQFCNNLNEFHIAECIIISLQIVYMILYYYLTVFSTYKLDAETKTQGPEAVAS